MRRFTLHLAAILLPTIALQFGCTTGMPGPAPSIAETDPTLSAPIRPNNTEPKKPGWFDFENILDPRSRNIEHNLGF